MLKMDNYYTFLSACCLCLIPSLFTYKVKKGYDRPYDNLRFFYPISFPWITPSMAYDYSRTHQQPLNAKVRYFSISKHEICYEKQISSCIQQFDYINCSTHHGLLTKNGISHHTFITQETKDTIFLIIEEYPKKN